MFALPNPPNGHIPDSLAQLHTSLSIITFSFITISQPALLGLLSTLLPLTGQLSQEAWPTNSLRD